MSATESAFVNHLASYPSVSQAVNLVKNIGIVKKATEISKPYVDSISEATKPYTVAVYDRAKPAIAKADEFGDKFLSNVDAKFPAIKTVQASDVVDEVKHKINITKDSVTTRATDAANSVKTKYAEVYDAQGKPYVQGLESRIAPLNDKFDGVVDEYLPGDATDTVKSKTSISTTPSGGEFGRTYAIFNKLIKRLKPAAFSLRDSTLSHVQKVYSAKLSEQKPPLKDLSINVLGQHVTIKLSLSKDIAAATKTGFALANESFAKVYEYLTGKPVNKDLDATKAKAHETVEEAAEAAAEVKSTAIESAKTFKKKTKARSDDIVHEAQAAVY